MMTTAQVVEKVFHTNESDPRSYEYCLTSSENKAWKNSDSYGIWTYDLCDTGGALYQLS